MEDYIEMVANEKLMDIILVRDDSFGPGQFNKLAKMIKRDDIVPISFKVFRHGRLVPFIGIETWEAKRSGVSKKALRKLARKWKWTPSGQSDIIDIKGKRVMISDWLTDSDDFTDTPDCNWKSDEYVRGWNDCRQAVFEFYDV